MKTTNSKIRANVEELLNEVPAGKSRYSYTIFDKSGSVSGNASASYDEVVDAIKKCGESIRLWEVETAETPRTFHIRFSTDCVL